MRDMSKYSNISVGVLALQGDYECHKKQLDKLGVPNRYVRLPEHLENIDALIFPGGESTTMSKLIDRFDLREKLTQFGQAKPIWGTCAGMILLSIEIEANQAEVKPLGLIDIKVARTAYGRQVFSFETDLRIDFQNGQKSCTVAFIRAPRILSTGENVKILARYENEAVLVEKDNILTSSFHSELDDDTTLLEYFLDNFLVDKVKI